MNCKHFLPPLILAAACAAAAQVPAVAPPAPPTPAPHAVTPLAYAQTGQTWMGVGLADLTAQRSQALKLSNESGAEIMEVYPDSPAATAGLKVNDVVTNFNGQSVTSVRELSRMLGETPADRKVAVEVMRDGTPLKVAVQLSPRPSVQTYSVSANDVAAQLAGLSQQAVAARGQSSFYAITPAGRGAGANIGVATEDLTPQLASYFGLKDGQTGALVRSVTADGPAAKAGVQAGDVITMIGTTPVTTSRLLATAGGRGGRGQTLFGKTSLTVVRKGKEMNLELQMPAAISANDITDATQELQQALKELETARTDLNFQNTDVSKLRAELQRAESDLSMQERKLQEMLRRLNGGNITLQYFQPYY